MISVSNCQPAPNENENGTGNERLLDGARLVGGDGIGATEILHTVSDCPPKRRRTIAASRGQWWANKLKQVAMAREQHAPQITQQTAHH